MQQETQIPCIDRKDYKVWNFRQSTYPVWLIRNKLWSTIKQVAVPLAGTWNLFYYNNGKGGIQLVLIGSTTNAVFGSDWKLSEQADVTSILQATRPQHRMVSRLPSQLRRWWPVRNRLCNRKPSISRYCQRQRSLKFPEISSPCLIQGNKDPDLQISWPEGESPLMGKKSSFFIHSFSGMSRS